jgi:phenylalanyl-tRNA synthetase alpha chain
MGCGMIHTAVLSHCNVDADLHSGFAFGMGIDRIALLLHKIKDIRLLSENDIRFIKQFKSTI